MGRIVKTDGHGNVIGTEDAPEASKSSGNHIQQVGTTSQRFADNFAGAAYAAGAASIAALEEGSWQVVRNIGDMVITLNNGNLTVGMGTTNASELLLVGESNQSIPANLVATLLMSQRIAGNEVRFGYVEIDPSTGLPVPHATLPGFFRNYTAALFQSTVATTTSIETMADNLAAVKAIAVTSMTTTAAACEYAIEARNEDISIGSGVADSTAVRVAVGGRLSTVVPNPTKLYRPFIWLRNVSAPATNTNVTFYRVVALDVQELQAEVGGGRGNNMPVQAIPVVQAATGVSQDIRVTAAVMSALTNSNLLHKLISAATTNATSVKTTAGRIFGGRITNVSASTRYFKFYQKASAPTVGTDVPVLTIPIPAGQAVNLAEVAGFWGLYLATGIAYAITAAAADNDTGAVAAGDVVVGLIYI